MVHNYKSNKGSSLKYLRNEKIIEANAPRVIRKNMFGFKRTSVSYAYMDEHDQYMMLILRWLSRRIHSTLYTLNAKENKQLKDINRRTHLEVLINTINLYRKDIVESYA